MDLFIKLVLTIVVLNFSNCQYAYRAKPELLVHVDKNRELELSSEHEHRSLADLYENHRGLVLIFWQSSCACVRRYQTRINQLFERYSSQGVAFVYVSSNSNESFAMAQAEYKKRHVSLPLMRDEGGHIARALGVESTPVAVLIDAQGKVIFRGWIDDERQPGERGRRAYLDDALKQYLAGDPILVPTSPMFGCPIR